jgi:uncharacterized membrane protein
MFQDYLNYLKDNPKGYWFKAKIFGWGWVPVKWQGWAVVLVYLILILAFGLTLDEKSTDREVMFTFVLPIVLLTATLIRICYKKGEKPHWQWGLPKKYNK